MEGTVVVQYVPYYSQTTETSAWWSGQGSLFRQKNSCFICQSHVLLYLKEENVLFFMEYLKIPAEGGQLFCFFVF